MAGHVPKSRRDTSMQAMAPDLLSTKNMLQLPLVSPLQWRDEQVVSGYQPFESEIWDLAAPFIDQGGSKMRPVTWGFQLRGGFMV